MKKLPKKLKGCKQYKVIKFALQNSEYDSLTPVEFQRSWNEMVEKYNLESNEWLIGLYNERHRWVPSFVKGSFWAGLFTTQRSESMHAFFDGYVNSKTTLKQFVEQYESALRSKVQNENQEDFNSFNSRVPCITLYDMEKQLQDAYTTSKFREFQQELTGKMYCELLPSVKEHGSIFEYEVSEDLRVGDKLRRSMFNVWLNNAECGEECEVKCNCRLFEFRGILCKHAIAVLIYKRIYCLPLKYIIQRWRKDVKIGHTKIRITYDEWSDKPEGRRYDNMCKAFQEVAELATDSKIRCDKVMDWISDLKGNLCTDEGVCGSNQPKSIFEKRFVGDGNGMSNENRKILTPLVVRSKGWPPCKRKQSKVEQVLKIIKSKKKRDCQEKGYKGSKMTSCDDPSTFEVDNLVGTQENIVVMGSQNCQSIGLVPNQPIHLRAQFHVQPQ